MTFRRIISLIISIVMVITLLPSFAMAEEVNEKTLRSVYLHAQGTNPTETTNNSTVYMGENADIYFAVDNPNKGDYDAATNTHKEPQYDMNGYTLRILFDPVYFDFASDETSAPIDFTIPDNNIPGSGSTDENVGNDVVSGVPEGSGYYILRHGSGTYSIGEKTYKSAYITVFYSGGYVPQKKDDQLWYNLAKLTLTPRRTGSTDVFIDIDSDDPTYALELFAKNKELLFGI